MLDFFSKHRGTSGVISIMLALLLLPIYSLTALIMESARIRSAQEQLSEFNELGCMAILADYIVFLEEEYGLLAFDSKATADSSIEDTFSAYLSHCATAGGVDTLSLNRLFGVSMNNCSVEGMYTLADPSILRHQIVQYGKFTIPAKSLMDLTLGSLLEAFREKLEKVLAPLESMQKAMEAAEAASEFAADYGEAKIAIASLSLNINATSIARNNMINCLNSLVVPTSTGHEEEYTNKFFAQRDTYQEKINALIAFMDEYESDIKTNYYSNNAANAGDAELTLTEQGALALNLIEGNTLLGGSFKKKDDKVKYTQVINSLKNCLSGIVIETSLTDFTTKDTTTSTGSVQTKGYTCYQNAYDELAEIKPWIDFFCGIGNEWANYKLALEGLKTAYLNYVEKFQSAWESAQKAVDAMQKSKESMQAFENSLASEGKDLPENQVYESTSILTGLVSSDLRATHDVYKTNFNTKYSASDTYRSMGLVPAILELKNNPSALDTMNIPIKKLSITSRVGINDVPDDASDELLLQLYNANIATLSDQEAASIMSEFSNTEIGYMDQDTLQLLFACFTADAFAQGDSGFNSFIKMFENIGDVLTNFSPSDPCLNRTFTKAEMADWPSKYLASNNYIYNDNRFAAADRAIVTVNLNNLNSYKGQYSYDYQSDIINGSADDYYDFTSRFGAMQNVVTGLMTLHKSINSLISKFDPVPSIFELFGILKDLYDTIKGLITFVIGLVEFIEDLISFIKDVGSGRVTLDAMLSVLLVNFYATDKFDSRVAADNPGYSDTLNTYQHRFDGAEVEYLIGGTGSESDNQTSAFYAIFFIRFLANLPVIALDSEIMGIVSGTTVASPIVFIGWVLAETYLDVVFLNGGGEIAFIKTKAVTAPSNLDHLANNISYIFTFNSEDKVKDMKDSVKNTFKDDDGIMSLDYNGYLGIILMFYSDTVKLARIADLLQMNVRQNGGDTSFLLSNAKTYVRADIKAQYHPLLPLFSMSGNNFDFLQMRSLQYNGY